MKYMATKPLIGDNPPLIVFQHSQSNFFFADSESNACFVKPYFVVYDGNEILSYTNSDGEIEIGFPCLIERPNGWFIGRRNSALFNQLIDQTILAYFYKFFPNVKLRNTGSGQNNGLDRPIGEYIDIPRNQIQIFGTNRAGYSLDHKSLYSFHFICLPSNKTIQLISSSDTPTCTTIALRDFIRTGLVAFKLNFLSKAIAIMLGTGDIVLPTLE